MGKVGPEEEQSPVSSEESVEQNAEGRGWWRRRLLRCGCGGFGVVWRVVGLRCVVVIVLSVAVSLSAVFWLLPLLHFPDPGDPYIDYRFKDHDIIASFMVKKPISLLEHNTLQLVDNISDEISVDGTKVVILSLEPSPGSNITKVVFGVDPEEKDSGLSSTAKSLVRASFEYLVVNQSLQLTKPLFGDPFSFEVLKFPGGITVIPPQSAFLLQKVQVSFNFTLNFPIDRIQVNFAELTSQLKTGLHLTPYENLYLRLSNSKGSTVAPPTTIQASVLLAIGNTPSMQRLKQLAQAITGRSRNLGLNNTVFGRVKQVRLSSILQHSLHGGEGGSPSPSPSPSPLPYNPHHHQHHHHHHHHNHHNDHLGPSISPTPATERSPPASRGGIAEAPQLHKSSPTPQASREAKPPGCRTGHNRFSGNSRKPYQLAPTVPPNVSPHSSTVSPRVYLGPVAVSPTPAANSPIVPGSSPLPSVVYAHVEPPSMSHSDEEHTAPPISQSPFSTSTGLPTAQWAFQLCLAVILQILY